MSYIAWETHYFHDFLNTNSRNFIDKKKQKFASVPKVPYIEGSGCDRPLPLHQSQLENFGIDLKLAIRSTTKYQPHKTFSYRTVHLKSSTALYIAFH